MRNPLSVYSAEHRALLVTGAFVLIAAIAAADWLTDPFISLGFLYLFPVILLGGLLSRPQVVGVAFICSALQEAFSNLPPDGEILRLTMGTGGFAAAGLFVSELVRNRRIASRHVEELESQVRLRREAEEQLRVLIESSPAAIVTLDERANVLLANEAAQRLLAPDGPALPGQPIRDYLPSLDAVAHAARGSRTFRTTLQCTGRRLGGEVFLAGVWFSTFVSTGAPRLAAIIVDLSEEARGREDVSLDHLLTHARIVMSAVAHEIRNVCSAVLVVHKNLSKIAALEQNEDFIALGTLIEGLGQLAELELRPSSSGNGSAVDLNAVLDELRVLVDVSLQESEIESHWLVSGRLPHVWADRYALVQVFLNLIRNSQRALAGVRVKQLRVVAGAEDGRVVIHVEDTGPGVETPEQLFRPFRPGSAGASGLGLYVSRAILRSFGGDLVYEPRPVGCCFAVVLHTLVSPEEPKPV